MMRHVLYIDESSKSGSDRSLELARALGNDVSLQFLGGSTASVNVPPAQRWDLFIADTRGLAASQRAFLEQVIESDPDAAIVLVTERLDEPAAEAMLRYAAVDCLTWRRGARRLAKTIRRTLTRLAMARRAIRSMDGCIDELDVTMTIDRSPKCARSLARYALRHIVRMDVCSLQSQFRAIRAFEEAFEKLLQNEQPTAAETSGASSASTTPPPGRPSSDNPAPSVDADPTVFQVRIHLSRDGLRFTLRCNESSPVQPQDGKVTRGDGFAAVRHLWFTPLLMDEIAIDEARRELTMLKLPDHVCSEVFQAIAARRNARELQHDVLGDVLNVVEVQNRDDPDPPSPTTSD